jgi:hypothetical protein
MSEPQTNNPPKLYLSPASGHRASDPASYGLTGLLGKLACRFGLDVHGPTGLTRSAAVEMRFAAFLLAVIFAFDWLAWSLLWNVVFNQGLFSTNLYTGGAVVAGAIFAMATLVYERQFLTSDTSDKGLRKSLAVLIRLVVLGIAAVATSQPIELLVFNGPIQERVHQEGIRHTAASKLSSLEEVQKNARLGGLATIGVKEERRDARTGLAAAGRERKVKEDELNKQKEALGAAERRLSTLRGRPTPDTESGRLWLRNQIDAAERRRKEVAAVVDDLQQQLDVKQQAETLASQRVNNAETVVNSARDRAARQAQRLLDWVSFLQTSPPPAQGQTLSEPTPPFAEGNTTVREAAWTYPMPNADFFQRLRILEDLKYGRAAQWKDVTPENRRKLINIFKLKDASPDPNDAFDQAVRSGSSELAITVAREEGRSDEEVDAAGRQADREAVLALARVRAGERPEDLIQPEILAAGRQAEREARDALERLRIDSELFMRNYQIAFYVAIAIPLLVFAMKLLMGRELRNYYSSEYQKTVGNYGSLVFEKMAKNKIGVTDSSAVSEHQ